jgi:hypothetical protein
VAAVCLALIFANIPNQSFASITGGKGNKPITDPGWPKGAAVIFNHNGRVAWWEGPPFGGGQWRAECRGDAESLNAVLKNYAKVDAKIKRLVVHDGLGESYWLNPNGKPDKKADAWMQWSFMVWVPANWQRLNGFPAGLRPADQVDSDLGPPMQIDVYAGGKFVWEDVHVPEGITVTDLRLEAHGFTAKDGIVLVGKITDLATDKPITGQMQLQLIEPQPKGGYRYSVMAEVEANQRGDWVLKHTPRGWYRVVVLSEGYVPKVIGHDRFDDRPRLHSYNGGLAPAVAISGLITDERGKPLPGVDVRLGDVTSVTGGIYRSPESYLATTDAKGQFRIDPVPVGEATIRLRKAGYCRPGLGQPVSMPAGGIKLTMMKSAEVQVTVDFMENKRPKQYVVNISPEGGSAVGKWSGSGYIDTDDQIVFRNIPPGRYVLEGHPNPTARKRTNPVIIELKGGVVVKITLRAK